MRPLSLPGFLGGVLMGASVVWMLTAAWIETAPASVLPNEYGAGVASQGALDHCDFEDVLVLGDSKILVGLDRPAMSFGVSNFAQGGGNPAADFYRTKSFPHCKPLPKLVVLSYSALNVRRLDPVFINNLLSTKLLSQADLYQMFAGLEAEDGGASLVTLPTDEVPGPVKAVAKLPFPIRTLLYKADFPPLYWASMQASLRDGLLGRWNVNRQAGERALHPIGHDTWDWSPGGQESRAIFKEAAITGMPRSRAIEGYYKRLVDRFAERGIPVLIASIPVNEPTFRAIPLPVRDEYAAFLHGLSSGRSNVTVLDPVWRVWPATSFADSYGHVNESGEAEITRLINRCITALLHPSDSHGAADCTMDLNAL